MLRQPQKHLQKQWRKLHRTLSKKGMGILPFLSIITLISGFFLWYTHNRIVRDNAEASSPATTIQFLNNNIQAAESQTNPVIPIVLNGIATQAVTVNYTIIGGTAIQDTDYILPSNATISIPNGERGIGLPLTLINDKQPDDNETIQIELSNPTGGVTLGGNTILQFTITDSKNVFSDPYFGLADDVQTLPDIQNPIPSSLPDFSKPEVTTLPDLSITDPTSLTISDGLVLHLDADTITSADGSAISSWADLSGNGVDVTQNDSNKQPTITHNSLNGKKTLNFDGNDGLISTLPVTDSNELTLISVSKGTNAPSNSYVAGLSSQIDLSNFMAHLKRNDFGRYAFSRSANTGSGSYDRGSSADKDAIDISLHGPSEAELEFYFDGILSSNAGSNGSAAFNTTQKYASVGEDILSGQSLSGDVAEVIVFDRRITEIERKEIQCYLSQKYAIEVNGCGNPLALHLDANSVTGNDGDPIALWPDDSGNNRDFTQSISGKEPILRTNALNGHNYLEFNDDYMTLLGNNLFTGGENTTFIVSEETNNAQGFLYTYIEEGSTGNNIDHGIYKASSSGITYSENDSTRLTKVAAHGNDFDITSLVRDPYTASLYIHGRLVETDTDTSPSYFETNHDIRLGAYTNTSTAVLRGGIAEMIVFNRALSEDEHNEVECFLVNKYELNSDSCGDPLQFHLDADALPLADGAAIGTWTNEAGTSLDAIQTDSNAQPTLVHNAVNGKKVVRFDGVDDHLRPGEFYTDNSATFITVAKQNNPGTNEYVYANYGDNSNERMYYYIENSNKIRSLNYDDDGHNTTIISNGDVSEYFISGYRQENQYKKHYFNNEEKEVNVASIDFYTNYDGGTGDPSIGANVGSAGTVNSGYWDGDIAEILYFNRPLTEEEFLQVRCYLSDKYAISTNQCGQSLMLNLDANTISLANNSPVPSWSDTSGNTYDAFQGDSNKQPLVIENALNGNKVLRFDGVDDYLELPEFLNTQDFTMYFVGTKSQTSTGNSYLFSDYGDNTNQYIRTLFNSSNDIDGEIRVGVQSKLFSLDGEVSPPQNFIYKINSDDINLNQQYNETVNSLSNTSFDTTVTFDGTFQPPVIGADDGGSGFYYDGDLAQLVIFDGSLTENQSIEIECYLSQKYDIDNNSCYQDLLGLKLDADDLQSEPGDSVVDWGDSDNGLVLSQSTPSIQPDFDVTDGVNSVLFSGGEYLTNNASSIRGTAPFTQIFTIEPTNLNTSPRYVYSVGTSITGNRLLYGFYNNRGYFVEGTNAANSTPNDSYDNRKFVTSFRKAGSNYTNSIIKFDNEQFNVNLGNEINVIGTQTTIGSQNQGSGNYIGKMFNFYQYDRDLGDELTELSTVALAAKTKLALPQYQYSQTHPAVIGVSPQYTQTNSDSLVNIELLNPTSSVDRIYTGVNTVTEVQSTNTNLPGGVVSRWNHDIALDETGDTEMNITFDFDKYNGGTPGTISNYELLYRANIVDDFTVVTTAAEQVDGSKLTYTVTTNDGVQDGYYTLGTSNLSASPLGAINIPEAIDDFSATLNGTYGEVDLTFTQPETNGNTIVDYIIEYSTNDFGTTYIYDDGVGTNTSYTLTDMFNGPNYQFRVKSITSNNAISNPSNEEEVAFAPRINSITPNTGVPEGNQQVVIEGDNFDTSIGQEVIVDNSLNPAIEDKVISFTFDTTGLFTSGKVDSDCKNLSLINNQIPQSIWIDDRTCNTSNTLLYAKVSVGAGELKTYNLTTLPLGENGLDPENTFNFFEDFDGDQIDSTKWDINGEGTQMVVDNGYLNIIGGGSSWHDPQIFSKEIFQRDEIELITNFDCGNSGNIMFGWMNTTTPVGTGSHTEHPYKFYYTNTTHRVYENNTERANMGSHNSCEKKFNRITLKENQGAKFETSLDGLNWDVAFDGNNLNNSEFRIGFNGHSGTEYKFDSFVVKETLENEPIITFGPNDPSYIGTTIKIDGILNRVLDFDENNNVVITTSPTNDAGNGLGSKDVVVTNPDSQSDTEVNGFTFVGPTINSITPDQGSIIGTYDVELSGTNFPLSNKFIGEQSVVINNDTGGVINNAEVFLTFDSQDLIDRGFLDASCGNLRTRVEGGLDINHWLEFGCNANLTGLWVQIPSLAVGSSTIEIYFAGSGSSSLSDSSNFSFDAVINGATNKLWLKADEFAGQSDGSQISTWTDNSTSGLDATSVNVDEQPVLELDSLNGLPSVKFDGANDFLANYTAGPIPQGDDSYSIILVWSPEVSQSTGIFDQTSSTSQTGQRAYIYQSNTQYGFDINGSSGTRFGPSFGEFALTQLNTNETGSSNTQNILNDNVSTATFDNATKNISNDQYGLGFNSINNNGYFNGRIAEVMVFDEDLSGSTTEIRAYLNQKYQIFDTLPTIESVTEKFIPLQVDFGGQPATNISIADEQTISLRVPAQVSTGGVTVTLTTPYGNQATIPFNYIDPQLTSVVQSDGAVEGGYQVAINGAGFVSPKKFRKVTLDHTANGTTLNDYQFRMVIDTESLINEGALSADCKEIGVVDTDKVTKLPFWVEEETCATQETVIWTKLATLTANSTKEIYIEIDQTRVVSESNGDDVFILFDNFEGSSLDTDKWQDTTGGNLTFTDGYMENHKTYSGLGYMGIFSNSTLSGDVVVEARKEFGPSLSTSYDIAFGLLDGSVDTNTLRYRVGSSGFRGYARISSAQFSSGSTSTREGLFDRMEIERIGSTANFTANYVGGQIYDASISSVSFVPQIDLKVFDGWEFSSNWTPNTLQRTYNIHVRNAFASEPNVIIESEFSDNLTFEFNGVPATNLEFINSGQYNVTVPASNLPGTVGIGDGFVDVAYTDPNGFVQTLTNAFEYKLPTLVSITPTAGPDQGGNDLVFSGNYLAPLGFKREIVIDNQTGSAITDYEEMVVIDTESLISDNKLGEDCSQLRVKDPTGSNIPFYIDEGCGTPFTPIWFKVANLNTGLNSIFIHYDGSQNTSSLSDKSNFSFDAALSKSSNFYWSKPNVVTLDQTNNVNAWPNIQKVDDSGVQSVASERPLWTTNPATELPSLYFDGGDNLETDFDDLIGSPHTLIASVARTSNSARWVIGTASLSSNQSLYLGFGSNTSLQYYANYTSGFTNGTIPGFDGVNVINETMIGTADTSVGAQLFYNGALLGTDPSFSYVTNILNGGRIGEVNNGSRFIGHINEVILYNEALNTTDRQSIENYLDKKYDINSNITLGDEAFDGLTIDGLPVADLQFIDAQTYTGRAPANTGIDKDVEYTSLLGNSSSIVSGYDYGVDLAPNTINDLSATVPASGVIELSWSEPNNNGQPITDYIIEYATQSDFSDAAVYNDGVGILTDQTISDLNAITTYFFRVRSINSVGTSPNSNEIEVTGQACDVDYGGQDWIVDENTTVGGVHCNIDEFRVDDTIILDITDESKFEVYANDINIIGTIDGSGAGFQANSSANCNEFFGFGPGGGQSNNPNTSGGGGAHGGVGGTGSNPTINLGGETMYGIIEFPSEFGSGGAAGRANCGSPGLGGFGGGAIKLNAPTVTVTGEIDVRGLEGVGGTTAYGNGFGAGGSIWIETTTLNGNGLITAQGGGNATDTGNQAGGAGGGGRVAIYYVTNNFTGEVSAEGGVMDSQPERNGGAGTLYWNNTTTGEEVIETKTGYNDRSPTRIDADLTSITQVDLQLIDASLDVLTPLTLTNTNFNVGQDQNVYLISGTTFANAIDLDISGTLVLEDNNQRTFNDVIINSGGNLTHSPNTDTIEHSLDFVANSVTIASGGQINVDGKGYTGTTENGNGPGGGVEAIYVGPGGSYGGLGGNGGDFAATGTGSNNIPASPVYGSKSQPSELGSAGGASSIYNSIVGGTGGGVVKITSSTFTSQGLVTANGLPGSVEANFGVGGSGAGGSIWIDADTLGEVGTLTANGGDAGSVGSYAGTTYGANGGGGRIALYYEDRGTGSVTTSQGQEASGTVAEDGTVYEDQIPEINLTSATFDSIPDPVSINASFDVRIKDILNVYGNPIRKGFVDDVVCEVTINGDGGNYNETITGGFVEDGVCILPSSFVAPTVTGPYTADIKVTGSDTAQTQESKTAIPFTVVAQASNLAAAQIAPNDSKPQFTTLNPAAVQIIGETTSINITGLVDSGNGAALNGITCDFRITGPSSYDQTFTSPAAIGGECQYDFAQFELPPVAGTYAVEVIVQGDSGLLTTDPVNFDREFDIELNVADQIPGLNTSNKDPLIGDEENIITSPVVYKYDGITLIDEGLVCEISLQDNTNTDIYASTINSAGQCEVTVPVSTLTGSSVDIITQVTLPVNAVDYDFATAPTTIALVGSPSNLAKEDIGNPGQPVFTAITVSSDPAFLDQNVTLTVTGLLDSITDQPLEIATCNFAVTNPNTNSFVFNTTTASAGECSITVPGPDLLDGGQEVPGTYSFLLNISGDSGTLSTTSLNFDREYNIDLVGGLIPGSSTTTPTQVVVGQTYSVRSPRIYQFNGTTNILNGLPCENEVIVNGAAPQTVSGTTSNGYCTTSMPASGATGNGTIVSRVTVASSEFETAATPFEVKALNNAQICGLVFRDDTSDQSYDGNEVLLEGQSIRLKDNSGATVDTKTTVNTGYVCFGSLFDGDYTLEILNGGPGGTQTLPTGGNNFFSITLAPGGTENRGFGFNGNAPVCPYPIFEDTDENGSQNGGEPSLVDIATTLPLVLYEVADLVTPIDTINANGTLCFSGQAPGDYVVEMDIPADMSPTGSGFTVNGNKITKPVTVGFGVQGDVAFSFSFDPTGDPVEDPINPGQPINNGTIVNSSQIVYEGYNFDATTGGLLDTGNNQALEGLDGATCSMEFTGPSFPGGLIKSGVVTAGECYVDPVPDTPGPHGVTTTVDGPSGNPLITIITTFDVVENNIDICPQPFRDYDLNGTRSSNEPFIAGLSVDLVDNNTTNIVETITTDALGQNCFEEVDADDADDYQVNITPPTNGIETTSTGLSVNVDPLPNQDETILFGFKGIISICLENIYMDNNGNSTQDGLEAGLQGHQIVLNDEFNNNLPVVLSDSNGRGCVDELLDATYTMQVQDPVNNNKIISLTGVQQGTRTIVAAAGSGNGSNTNEFVESYGYQNDAEICPNPTFADYDKDGVFDNGEDEIGGLDTRLYQGTNNTGTLLETISTNGSLCFDPVPTADTGGEFDFYIEQDLPTGGVLTTIGETYTFTQSFGIQVDKIFGYKGNATICPYPTFQDNNQNGVFDSEPTIDGVTTTLKDTSNTTIGTLSTNHTTNPCFTELLEGSYILSQERPENTVSTTGGTIQNVVTTAGNQEDVEFGYDGRPLICPVVYRDDNGNGVFDVNEFRFTQVDITLRDSGSSLLETIDSESTEKCFNTDFTEVGQTYIVESLPYPSYTITTSIANGSPNDNPDNTSALVFGQKYEPEFGYNGNGTICAQNVFEDFNANGSYDAGVDTYLPDGTEIVLTTLQGSTNYPSITITGGNACFTNIAPGQYTIDVEETDKPAGSISTTGGVQTLVLSPGETQNYNFGFTGDATLCPHVTFEDLDFDALYSPSTESQLSGITVNIYRGADLINPYKSLTLSGSGTECFTGLFADNYRVEQVDLDTVFTGQYWNTTEATQSGTDPDDFYEDVTIASQDYLTVDFGYTQNSDFTLGAIFGFLYVDRAEDGTYDIAGADDFELTVFDNDVPVVDQTVKLFKFNTSTTLFEEVDATTSDANGNYEFTRLGVGDYEIRIPNTSLVGIKSVNPNPSTIPLTITNNATTGLNDKFYDQELSFQFTARICPFLYIDLNEDGNYDVGSDYPITENEGAEYGLSYTSFNGTQSAGNFTISGSNPCIEELPPRDYTVTLSDPFGTAQNDGAFGPSNEYPINFYDQFDEQSFTRTVFLASEINDIETRLFSVVNIDRTPSIIEGRIWNNRPIYGSSNPYEATFDADGGDDKTESIDDPGNTSGYDYDWDNDFGYGGVTLELIKCFDGFQDPVPTTVWNANPPTAVTDADGFYRFDDTNVNFTDGMSGFYHLIPGDYAVIRQGSVPDEDGLTGIRAKQCEHFGIPQYEKQSIFFNNYPADAPQAPNNRTPITPGTTVEQNEMMFYAGSVDNIPFIDQSQNLLRDGTENSCYLSSCPSVPSPASHVYGEFELRDQITGDILAVQPYNINSFSSSDIGYSGVGYGGLPGIIPGDYEVEMINIEPLNGVSQPHYTEIQPGELIKSHTQLNDQNTNYDYGFNPLFGTELAGFVYINRGAGGAIDLDGADDNPLTDFDNDEPLQGYTVEIKDSADNVVATETTDINGAWSWVPGGQGLPEGAYSIEVLDAPPTGTNCLSCTRSTYISVLGGTPSDLDLYLTYGYVGYIGSDAFVDNDQDGLIEDTTGYTNTDGREIAIRNNEILGSRVWDFQVYLYYEKGTPQEYLVTNDYTVPTCGIPAVSPCIDLDNLQSSYFMNSTLKPGTYTLDLVINDPSLTLTGNSTGQLTQVINLAPQGKNWVRWAFNPRTNNTLTGNIFVDRGSLNETLELAGEDGLVGTGNDADSFDNELPLTGFTVKVNGPNGAMIESDGPTDANGNYTFTGIETGLYRLFDEDFNNPGSYIPFIETTDPIINTLQTRCITIYGCLIDGTSFSLFISRGTVFETGTNLNNNMTYIYTNSISGYSILDLNGDGVISSYSNGTFDEIVGNQDYELEHVNTGKVLDCSGENYAELGTGLTSQSYNGNSVCYWQALPAQWDGSPSTYTIRKLANLPNQDLVTTRRISTIFGPSSNGLSLGAVDQASYTFNQFGVNQQQAFAFYQSQGVVTNNASITGFAFIDINNDGIFQPDGLDGDPQTLEDNETPLVDTSYILSGDASRTADAGSLGQYQFTDLPQGNYTITSDIDPGTVSYSMRIIGATLVNDAVNGDFYRVTFSTQGFEPETGGRHLRFYWDTEDTSVTGQEVFDTGPYEVPIVNRPGGSDQICAVIMEDATTPIPNSGDCQPLP